MTFTIFKCPPDLIIPTTDDAAWTEYEDLRWVYNKMELCKSQDIDCSPYGIYPEKYPVFMKPVHNLSDNSVQSLLIRNEDEYNKHFHPGSFWMEFLDGDHLSIDMVVIKGRMQWCHGFKGYRSKEDLHKFERWEGFSPAENLTRIASLWAYMHLKDYTGCVNFEIIKNRIIECHLRFQHSMSFGNKELFDSIIKLYSDGEWDYEDNIEKCYIIPIYGKENEEYEIEIAPIKQLEKTVHSIKVFPEHQRHSDSEGNIRLALINSFDLTTAQEAEYEFKDLIW